MGWKPHSRPRPTWRWRSSSQPESPSSCFPSAGGAVTPKAGAGSSSCPSLPQPPAKQPASSLHCQGPALVLKGSSKAAHICCCSHWQLRHTKTHITVLGSCMGLVPALQSFGKPHPALHEHWRGVAAGTCSFSLPSLILLPAPTLLRWFAHFPTPFPAPDELLECHARLNTPVPCSTLLSTLPLAAPHLSAQGKPYSSSDDAVNPQTQFPPQLLISSAQGLPPVLRFRACLCISHGEGTSGSSCRNAALRTRTAPRIQAGFLLLRNLAASESELDIHQEQTIYLAKTWSLTWKNPTCLTVCMGFEAEPLPCQVVMDLDRQSGTTQ